MDKREVEFTAKLLMTFKIEAAEHLKALSDGFLALETCQTDEARSQLVETIFREAHSLKGAARAVNFDLIQNICQSFENVLSALKHKKIEVTRQLIDTCYATVDLITLFLSGQADKQTGDNNTVEVFVDRLDNLLKTDGHTPDLIPETLIEPSKEPQYPTLEEEDHNKQSQVNPEVQTIRVSLQKLDLLLHHIEEMLVVKQSYSQQVADMHHLEGVLGLWEEKRAQIHHHMQFFKKDLKDRKDKKSDDLKKLVDYLDWEMEFVTSLNQSVAKIEKSITQDNRLMSGMIDSLLDDAKKVIMQPIATLLEGVPRMVRELSRSLGKEVQLDIQGSEIEIDRRILEEMKDPITHLIRNAIDHGIEQGEERIKRNKSSTGKICIIASQISGNRVELSISDDGEGIDLEAVKKSAIKQGVLSFQAAESLEEKDVISLIFQSGVSSSPIISELSGRGLGLVIVSDKVEKLGGKLSIENQPGVGTLFKIVLPVRLATFRGIHFNVMDQDFIMPLQHVNRVVRIEAREIKTVENCETIMLDGELFSFIYLSDLLGISEENRSLKNTLFVMLVKAGEKTIAFGVDEILNEQEVLVKGLGKQLERVRNIAGATVMEEGRIVPILDPFDLVKSAIRMNYSKSRSRLRPDEKLPSDEKQIILLAEDSITARILFKNILESAGYVVKTAVDGSEALSLLKTEKVDLLLSDVEMPRIDGFELTQTVRNMEKFKDFPIVLITSRGSKEDREHGIKVGANAYLEKSGFAQNNFLNIIQQLL